MRALVLVPVLKQGKAQPLPEGAPPAPSRGSTWRLRISQPPIAAAVAGRRIHTPAVLTEAICASTLWYQSNGASLAPKKR